MSPAAALWRRAAAGAVFGVATLTAGCDDGAPTAQPKKVVSSGHPQTVAQWLTPIDKTEPSVWIRSREVAHRVLPSDPEVDRLRRAMHQAGERFYEDQRMIANRTVQTGEMLAEIGQPERYVDILTGLIDIADLSASRKLYGEMCQHYVTSRKAGLDRKAALDVLADKTRHATKPGP